MARVGTITDSGSHYHTGLGSTVKEFLCPSLGNAVKSPHKRHQDVAHHSWIR